MHCRVGVSRSATICIAEVMSSLGLSFPRAYCYVRARRLNVIIQPHLRFVYELLKWDERLQAERAAKNIVSTAVAANEKPAKEMTDKDRSNGRKRRRSEADQGNDDPGAADIGEDGDEYDDDEQQQEAQHTISTTRPSPTGIRRELDWPTICREIASLNKPYARQ